MYKEKKCLLEALAENKELLNEMIYLFKELARKDLAALMKAKKEGLRKPYKYVPESVIYSGALAKIQEFAKKYEIEMNDISVALSIFSEGTGLMKYIKGREKSERKRYKKQ